MDMEERLLHCAMKSKSGKRRVVDFSTHALYSDTDDSDSDMEAELQANLQEIVSLFNRSAKKRKREEDKLSTPQQSRYKSRRQDLRSSASSISSKETSIAKKLKSLESKEENLPKRKPLKICGVKERTRIGVAAATLEELRTKIKTQIASIGDDFKIVLEEDCTRIEDEDYFKTLPDNTVLMAVSEGEQWTGGSSFGPASSCSSLEEEFNMGFVEVDGKMTQEETSQRLAQVAGRIAENPSFLAFLPKVDLEVMVEADLNELQVLLHQTKDKAEFIQDACERRLLDVIESDAARELLNLYHRVNTEDGGSLGKTEEGGALVKTEEGGSLAKTEEGGSLGKTEEDGSLVKTEDVGSPKRDTRSTRKKSKETS